MHRVFKPRMLRTSMTRRPTKDGFLTSLLLALFVLTAVLPHAGHALLDASDDAPTVAHCAHGTGADVHFDAAVAAEHETCVACMRQHQQSAALTLAALHPVVPRGIASAVSAGAPRAATRALPTLRGPPAAA